MIDNDWSNNCIFKPQAYAKLQFPWEQSKKFANTHARKAFFPWEESRKREYVWNWPFCSCSADAKKHPFSCRCWKNPFVGPNNELSRSMPYKTFVCQINKYNFHRVLYSFKFSIRICILNTYYSSKLKLKNNKNKTYRKMVTFLSVV